MINNEQKTSINNQAASPNAEEILSYLIESGIVDLGGVKESMKKSRRQAIIDNYI